MIDLRQELFSKQSENIPTTQVKLDVSRKICIILLLIFLQQHYFSTVTWHSYQCSIWRTSLQSKSLQGMQNVPSPDNFGWKRNENVWITVWTNSPAATNASTELLKCGCKAKALHSRKYHAAGISSTGLCCEVVIVGILHCLKVLVLLK